jgi:hypothetical protein
MFSKLLGNALLAQGDLLKIIDELKKPWELVNCEILAARKYPSLIHNYNDLITLLGQPLKKWPVDWNPDLIIDLNFQFLFGYEYNPEILDMIPSFNDIEGEFMQRSIMKIRNILLTDSTGADQYSKLRKFIVESRPMLREVFRSNIKKMHINPSLFTILEDEIFESLGENIGSVKQCSYCGRVYLDPKVQRCTMRCAWHNAKLEPKSYEQGEWIQVRSAIHRYTVIPGMPEIDLYNKLQKKGKFQEIILYPNFDEADIELVWSEGQRWAIDLKDCLNIIDLAKKIDKDVEDQSHQKWDQFYYVIPEYMLNYQPNYIKLLKEAVVKTPENYQIKGMQDFLKIVDQYANKNGE